MLRLKVIILVLLLMIVRNIFSKINIAVFNLEPIGINKNISNVNSDILREALMKYPKFKLIEREELNSVVKEQKLQTSGLVSNRVKIGNLTGAQKIIYGKLAKYNGKYVKYMLTIKSVDVESGNIDLIKNFEVANDDKLKEVLRSCASYLAKNIKIPLNIFENNGEWFISGGSDSNIKEGEIFTIFKISAITSEKNSFQEEIPIGLCKVIRVFNTVSKVKILTKKEEIQHNNYIKKGNYLENFELKRKGKIIVNSIPNEAKIYLNSNFIGNTPKEIDDLPAGKYIIEIRKGGFSPYKGKVYLTEGRIINIKRELKAIVELKDLISDINIPRDKTNPKKALLLGFIPGGGAIYNKYPKKGIATMLGTIIPLMGSLLANDSISNYETRLNDNPEVSFYDQYSYEIENNNVELSKEQLYLSIPFIGFGYLYSIFSSYFDAKSDFYEKQYLLFSFDGYTYSINQSQTPDNINQPAYFNDGIHSLKGSKSSMNISIGFISKYYDMFFQMGVYDPFLASFDLTYKLPIYKALSLGFSWHLGSYFDNDPPWYESNPTVNMDDVIPSIETSYFVAGNIIINSNNFYLNLGYSPNSIVAAYTFNSEGSTNYTFLHGFDMLGKGYFFINEHFGIDFSGRYGNYEAPPYEKYDTITRVDNFNYIELRLGISLRY